MSPRMDVAPRTVRRPRKAAKLSRTRKPDEMTLEEWQIALRREFGRQQKFRLKNLGPQRLFSEFEVTNPQTRRTYRVAIRGGGLGENFCSCPDFAVNTLGTCKHVEFVLGRIAKTRADKLALAAGFRPAFSEVFLQYGAKREVVFRPGTGCPEPLRRLARRYFDEHGLLKEDAYGRFHTFLAEANRAGHEIRCYEDVLGFIAQVRDREALRRRIAEAFPKGIQSAAFKRLVKAQLYRYQREGALFAARAGRCLLADDMGLGKTIQAIAATEILARTAGLERVLIICPTSLKHQWEREIAKFAPRPTIVVEGLLPRRAECYAADSFYKITNYDVVRRDLDLIEKWQPDLIVLDEAQRIKNWKTRTAQTVKRLQSQYTFVLTGTPLENRLEELHSIVEFVDRFRLGPMFRFLCQHQHVDEHGRVVGYHHLGEISQTLEPILIRRLKEAVLKELPERMDKQFFVPMTEEQMNYHEENRAVVARVVQKWRRYGFLSETDQRRLMIALQNMRMSCNSTYLLDQETDHGVKADEAIELLGEVFEDPATKVVVFSQWVRMHELVAGRLENRKWDHVMFYGGVPGPKRRGLVERFKEDPKCRLFLTTDAGGVGLNLQNASMVLNLDQPWNPAVLEQRIGRVHRLGQHHPVRVVHFIAQGTIEEGMLGLLDFKRSMFSGVLDGGRDEVFLGGSRLKRFMESVEKATGSIPESMPAASEPNGDGQAAAEEADEGPDSARGARPRREAASQPATTGGEAADAAAEEPWTEIVTAGMSFLEKLGRAVNAGKPREAASGGAGLPALRGLPPGLVAQDEATGRPCLKLPLPGPDVMQKIVDILGALAGQKW
jgi:superfamily II DNA or RNA helicase